jgi:hypothetical protein
VHLPRLSRQFPVALFGSHEEPHADGDACQKPREVVENDADNCADHDTGQGKAGALKEADSDVIGGSGRDALGIGSHLGCPGSWKLKRYSTEPVTKSLTAGRGRSRPRRRDPGPGMGVSFRKAIRPRNRRPGAAVKAGRDTHASHTSTEARGRRLTQGRVALQCWIEFAIGAWVPAKRGARGRRGDREPATSRPH